MPASWLVTNPPIPTNASVAPAVSNAKRCSQGVGEEWDMLALLKTKPLRSQNPQRSNQRKLFGFQREISGNLAAFYRHFLRGGSTDRSGFSMENLNRVGAVRHAFDRVLAVLVGHREVRIIRYAGISEHPGMHIALEPEEHLRGRECETQLRSIWHLRLVFFFITWRSRGGMNIMEHRVRVLYRNLLASLHTKYIRPVFAAFLVNHRWRSRSAVRFGGNAFQRHITIGQTVIRAFYIESCF